MSEIRGVDVLVSIKSGEEQIPVGGQRGATLNRSSNAIDVSNKVTGDWKRSISGLKEWSLDCNGLVVADDAGFTALETAFNEGAEVVIQLAETAGLSYSGAAIITDFPIEAPYEDVATYSISFTGTGALTKG